MLLPSTRSATGSHSHLIMIGITFVATSQAIGRDDLMWILKPFGYGSAKGDEPRVAIMLSWVVAQAALFMGDIDIVAPVITTFFIMSYVCRPVLRL